MNDQEFFDLAMKVIARQASDDERAEVDALLASQPKLKAEFERLEADARMAREVLPLMEAAEATAGELPGYARGRLQTKVRETLGRPQRSPESASQKERKLIWRWRWVLGLGAATAVVMLLLVPIFTRSAAPVIQLAMLDTAGATRGSESNEAAAFRQTWRTAKIDSFFTEENLRAWETNWPSQNNGAVVKVIFDRAAAEVLVLGRWEGKPFEKTFVADPDLAAALKQADAFIRASSKSHP